jgi:N-acetylmuramoyl-L-alanine amidase
VIKRYSWLIAAVFVVPMVFSPAGEPVSMASTATVRLSPQSSSVPKHWWYPNWSASSGRGKAQPWPSSWPSPVAYPPTARGPLSGHTILIDPGHNIGNSTHSSQINHHYWVGLDKICNTTGTATDQGYAEASYTFDVAQRLTKILRAAGAKVVLTRNQNSSSTYGPCIQARGLLGGEVGADLGVSIHADGGPSSGHGAFVYAPAVKAGYTSSTKAKQSYRLAGDVLAGLAQHGQVGSTYLHPNIAPDKQQGTLNVASIPIVIVETLNMRNAGDAAKAESASGRQSIAAGLAAGIERWIAGR